MTARVPSPRWSTTRRVGIAAIAAVVIAEAGALALRPSEMGPAPATVSPEHYFPSEHLERADEFRSGQRVLFVGTLVVEGGLLLLFALGRPASVGRAFGALGRRPLTGAAIAGAGISLALATAVLPLGIAAHERAVDVGLSTQGIGDWLSDRGKAAAISAAIAGIGATLAVATLRRFPRRWWIGASGAVVGLAVLVVWVAPVVLAPVFNDFRRLPEGELRSEVLQLARAAGVDVGEVYEVDASRRTTGANAYVDGLGPTKRVVLYDTLIESTDRRELRSVVAHELAHVKHRDLQRGILWIALIAPPAMLFVQRAAEALARRRGLEPGTPAGVPAIAIALAIATFAAGVSGNRLSRDVERRADAFALRLTEDPNAMIALQRRLAIQNVSDVDPPPAWRWLFGSHPPTLERIGVAEAWKSAGRNRSGD